MKRTTIMIPDDLKIRAVSRAQSEGISLGEFIRLSLEKALHSSSNQHPDDPFWADNSVYKGTTPGDLAQNHDEYLYGDS